MIVFPERERAGGGFFAALATILGDMRGTERRSDALTLRSFDPRGALPEVCVATGDVDRPSLDFGALVAAPPRVASLDLRVPSSIDNDSVSPMLSLSELHGVLRGHLVRADHLGINLPAGSVDLETWDALIQDIARSAATYRYPSGEPWPFILPTTEDEYRTEITRFTAGRAPKFELVHDAWTSVPVIQVDLQTDMTRPELEHALPEPLGGVLHGLGEFFRTTYVSSPWNDLRFRFDLRYGDTEAAADDYLAEWLVTEGGRIGPSAA